MRRHRGDRRGAHLLGSLSRSRRKVVRRTRHRSAVDLPQSPISGRDRLRSDFAGCASLHPHLSGGRSAPDLGPIPNCGGPLPSHRPDWCGRRSSRVGSGRRFDRQPARLDVCQRARGRLLRPHVFGRFQKQPGCRGSGLPGPRFCSDELECRLHQSRDDNGAAAVNWIVARNWSQCGFIGILRSSSVRPGG